MSSLIENLAELAKAIEDEGVRFRFPEYECPRCNAYADDYEIVCDRCGQRIDWSKSGL